MLEREYYKFNELNFSSRQMLWLIKHLPTLKEGRYPPDPVGGSSYVDLQGKKAVRHRATFENPVLIAAEVEARLAMCGLDGLILKAVTLWEEGIEYLSRCLGISEDIIIKRKSKALGFISGWRRKRISYREWMGHRKQ
jgi:hypothetical protein